MIDLKKRSKESFLLQIIKKMVNWNKPKEIWRNYLGSYSEKYFKRKQKNKIQIERRNLVGKQENINPPSRSLKKTSKERSEKTNGEKG